MNDIVVKVEKSDEHGAIVTARVQLPESGWSFTATGYWEREGNLHSETRLGVNWPSLGTVPLSDAEDCAQAISLAGRKIAEIAKNDNPVLKLKPDQEQL